MGPLLKNVLKSIEKLSLRFSKIIFYRQKFDSIGYLRDENKLYAVKEMHAFELFKALVCVLRQERKIGTLLELKRKLFCDISEKVFSSNRWSKNLFG